MPAPPSVYLDILNGVKGVVDSLSLTDWNNNVVPSYVRKVIINRRGVDAVTPAIYIAPGHHIRGGSGGGGGGGMRGGGGMNQEGVEEVVFGPNIWVWYPVMISLIVPGNQDVNAHLDYLFGWRQILRRSFQKPTLAGVSAVWDVHMHPVITKEDQFSTANWDAELLSVEFRVVEPRDYP